MHFVPKRSWKSSGQKYWLFSTKNPTFAKSFPHTDETKTRHKLNSGISINESRHRCTIYVNVHVKDNENLCKTELIIGKVCILFIFMYSCMIEPQ